MKGDVSSSCLVISFVSYLFPMGWGKSAVMTAVCLSVCLSVPLLTLSLETEGPRKLKIDRSDAHDKSDP